MQALQGIKVLELGQLIAGPFAGKTLGDFGADVIKVEPPGTGDPLRKWRLLRNGTSVWWEVQSRNKRSVVLDLREAEGQEVARELAKEADVVIENFKPGTLEGWGLGWEALHALNPRLIMLRISATARRAPTRIARASASSANRWADCAISRASRGACRCASESPSAIRSPRFTV
jgi:formyl-CoA transferase